ncbi:MAG: 4Fe-4S dicluster domain-containing protein, partial [bacterium]
SHRGDTSLSQPLIEPLYGSWSDWEMVNFIVEGSLTKGYDIIRQTWKERLGAEEFEEKWRKYLHDGVMTERINPVESMAFYPEKVVREIREQGDWRQEANSLEIVLRPSSTLYDGRFTRNPWLQELPDPLTKLTWDTPFLISEEDAQRLKLKCGDLVKLRLGGKEAIGPVWILPGQPNGSVTVPLGYSIKVFGRLDDQGEFNTYNLKIREGSWTYHGAIIEPLIQTRSLASTQEHWKMEERNLVRDATLSQFLANKGVFKDDPHRGPAPSLWKEHKYDEGYQWGMVVDLNSCIGCGACIVACQSENNIPVVGREQVKKNREMHWIRVDRYFENNGNTLKALHQPVMCQHCEMAPCEQVCPVSATNHDQEGINVMVYNRCVGTRYCSNNCPYKVRRFNFFHFNREVPLSLQLAFNPDVTVRSRGVMEKCTYCIQRINRAKRQAKL